MHYGVHLSNAGPFASPESIALMATSAELLGYDAVSVHDHIVWGYQDRYHHYAGSREAVDSHEDPTDFYEALSTLSFVAGITRRVKLIPDALALGWRPVALLAREALTLHRLSGGRLILCVCIGDSSRDYDAIGGSWIDRGKTTEENLKALRMIIDKNEPVSFETKSSKVCEALWHPAPQGLKIWYAGISDIAVKRAARYCDGWMGGEPDVFSAKMPLLRAEAELSGRANTKFDLMAFEKVCIAGTDEDAQNISWATEQSHIEGYWKQYMYSSKLNAKSQKSPLIGSPDTVAAGVRKYKSVGVEGLLLFFVGHSIGSIIQQMEMFSREVMPRV